MLGSDPAVRIAYEPPFFGAGTSLRKVRKETLGHFARANGIKHVWDPNGWPFRNPDHASSLEVLARSGELITPNRVVLDCADKVVLLRRRNAFQRTLSDLWGQPDAPLGARPAGAARPLGSREIQGRRASS